MQVLSSHFTRARDGQRRAGELTQLANEMIVQPRAIIRSVSRSAYVAAAISKLAVETLDRFAQEPTVVGWLSWAVRRATAQRCRVHAVYAELERRGLPFLLHPISPPGSTAC